MNITSKSRYALKAMIDLASQDPGQVVQRADIAQRQGIPGDYIDHILARLRTSGLILSIRGRKGGFKLAMPAEEISAWMIFSAVEESLIPVLCLDQKMETPGVICESFCSSRDAWGVISSAVEKGLSGIILSDLVDQLSKQPVISASALASMSLMGQKSFKSMECRAPRRS